MIPRTLESTIYRLMQTFPAIVVTGPRQAGKTTLLQTAFAKTHTYISFENPDVRMRATSDPIGFLKQYPHTLLLDEIQYVPELLSYIKTAIDEDRTPGKWIITGSQNFALMEGVSQSLAGRAAILSLAPFSLVERVGQGKKSLSLETLLTTKVLQYSFDNLSIEEVILRGSYPEISTIPAVDRQAWCGSYITTYIERDIRNLQHVGDLGQYELFLRACAARTGQILDISGIARDIGISVPTAKRWISLLETGYQILLVYPYYKNIGKRLVKRPKMYFTDTGLASYLMGIHTPEVLIAGASFGSLFETLVVTDFWKRSLHHGEKPVFYYLRTQDKLEIDLVIELGEKLYFIEIKSSSTIRPNHVNALVRSQRDLGSKVATSMVVSNAPNSYLVTNGIYQYPWKDFLIR